MKLTNEELRQIIKEELNKVLNEAIKLRHLALGPAMGTLYGATKGTEDSEGSFDLDKAWDESQKEKKRQWQQRKYEREMAAQKRKYEQEMDAQTQQKRRAEIENNKREYPALIASILSSRHGIAANANQDGGINIKHDGQILRLVPDSSLGLYEAIQDIIDQLDLSVRRKGSQRRMKRGEESITIDDPMMESKK